MYCNIKVHCVAANGFVWNGGNDVMVCYVNFLSLMVVSSLWVEFVRVVIECKWF